VAEDHRTISLAIIGNVTMTEQASYSKSSEITHQELVEREAELALINSVQLALASRLDVQAIYNLVGDKMRNPVEGDH
jgi:hypothetical protein